MSTEYSREETIHDFPWMGDDQPHAVVIIGYEKTKQFCNLIGPFPTKKLAKNYAAGQRRAIKRALATGWQKDHKWVIHVQPFIPPGGE